MKYKSLFKPIKIGTLALPNRIMMGAMHTNYEELPDAGQRLAAFYRARSDAGLIVTGGISPCDDGCLYQGAQALQSEQDLAMHQHVCQSVHQAGGRIALQILHAGRYAKIANPVSVNNQASRINPAPITALDEQGIKRIIAAHQRCAELAEMAGYDAVEIMGSEGYLLSTFLSPETNDRTDCWGGDIEARCQMPIEVIKAIKDSTKLPVIYRISAADLMPRANSLDEVQQAITFLEEAGADAINLGIGWHESPVPTISSMVPRAAFADIARKLTANVPMILSNRVNLPQDAEQVINTTNADIISMARPFLADPNLVGKAQQRPNQLNTCIACNQACLDRAFIGKPVGCVVNPNINGQTYHASRPKKIAIIGAGVAGLSCALQAANMGHQVTILEKGHHIGGQLKYAAMVPGKEEYQELLRYYEHSLEALNVDTRLNQTVTPDQLQALTDVHGFDEVVYSTGVNANRPSQATAQVLDYQQAFNLPREQLGKRVIVIGGGPIAVDFCQYIYGPHHYKQQWGIKDSQLIRPAQLKPDVHVTLLQRSNTSPHKKLGKTTGWAHWASLKHQGLEHHQNCEYLAIEPNRVVFKQDEHKITLTADSVVCCTGQEAYQLKPEGLQIGGCREARGIDAERAIREGFELALKI